MVPPGRLELPPPASEAGALSTELRGRSPRSIADGNADFPRPRTGKPHPPQMRGATLSRVRSRYPLARAS
jgi:hypothetical protein